MLATGLAMALMATSTGCGAEDERLGSATSELTAASTPIIIAHGLAGWPFHESIKPYLEGLGYTVLMPKVSPFGPVTYRAEELRSKIDTFLDSVGAQQGIIVAHSMGGVDARWLLSPDGLDYDRIAALVTVASPHRGTAIADVVIEGVPWYLQNRVDRLLKAMDLSPEGASDLEALQDLTTGSMASFNDRVGDSPDVQYYSYSSEQTPIQGLNPLLYVSYYMIKSRQGINDGVATREGAKWGHFLGNLNADHADHVGGLGFTSQFDFKGLYAGAIEAAFTNNNDGTYNPTFSKPRPSPSNLESDHDYWNNLNQTQTETVAGATGLVVTFDALTNVELDYDFIHVSDGDGLALPDSPFTGDELAGRVLDVPGDTVTVRLVSDFSVASWGYLATAVSTN